MAERTDRLEIRVTPPEKALLEDQAAAAGQTTSEYVRGALFPEKGRVLPDALDRRVRELSKTLPESTARKVALRELA